MIDDIQLRRHVLDELAWDPKIDATHVGVTAKDGAVQLTGHVESYPQLFDAGRAARRVKGVLAVANDLRVELPEQHRRDDSDIAESVAHVLRCNVSLPDSDIKAEVRNGIVTLGGTVDWQHQRRHVEKQVAHVGGVRAVSNQIQLTPRADAGDVREHIESALARYAELEAGGVSIEVRGDEVTLRGRVRSGGERDLVEKACWSSPGVKAVHDRLEIARE